MHTCMHTRIHACTHACTPAGPSKKRAAPRIHACTHTCTHTCMHAYARTHTRTQVRVRQAKKSAVAAQAPGGRKMLPGWSENYDRTHKQYYYVSDEGDVMWDWPTYDGCDEEVREKERFLPD